jgi:hypothetical protein
MQNELKTYIEDIYTRISEAARTSDLATIQILTAKVAELEQLERQRKAIQQRLTNLMTDVGGSSKTGTVSDVGFRKLLIPVTAGMIRQNLLTVTQHIRRGKVKVGEEMDIEALPSGEIFRTQILEKGNKLRARGEIARIYKDENVQADNYILLTETAPGHWTLEKAAQALSDT